jgi:hypothetical protein
MWSVCSVDRKSIVPSTFQKRKSGLSILSKFRFFLCSHTTSVYISLFHRLDPIWTIKTGSLFLLTVSMNDLFLNDGLVLILHDFDKVGSDEILGAIKIRAKQIYEAKAERMEFKLGPAGSNTEEVSGHMAIRCRRASDQDIQFMEDLKRASQLAVLGMKPKTLKIAEGIAGVSNLRSIITKRTRIAKDGPNTGKKQVSVG